MHWLNDINWEIVLAAIGTIIAALIGFYQIKISLPKPRFRLKTDLEILKLMGDKHNQYNVVKEQVDDLISDIYTTPIKLSDAKEKQYYFFRVIYVILGSCFLFWTYYILIDGWSWWAILTGYFSLGLLGNAVFYNIIRGRSNRLREQRLKREGLLKKIK